MQTHPDRAVMSIQQAKLTGNCDTLLGDLTLSSPFGVPGVGRKRVSMVGEEEKHDVWTSASDQQDNLGFEVVL